MIHFIKTNSENSDFLAFVKELDADLKIRDGEEHAFYAQYNKVDKIKHVLLALENDIPVGCGAIKEYDSDTMEVKRMFVPPSQRGKGIASMLLKELEIWAKELRYKRCILETGKKQFEALGLYPKNDYKVIPNYGQYEFAENSVCFEKIISE